jgi:hypothetical protein
LSIFAYTMDDASRGMVGKVEDGGLQAQNIAVSSEPHDLPDNHLGEVGLLTITLAASQIGEMHFDGGNGDGSDGITQRYTRVGIRASVDDQRIDPPHGPLNGLDEASLMVGLQDFKLDMVLSRKLLQAMVDFLQGHKAINPRFAATEQVEIRAMEH